MIIRKALPADCRRITEELWKPFMTTAQQSTGFPP
jgi:hypothetical protein